MLGYDIIFAVFVALGATRAIYQRWPRHSLVVAESLTITTFAGPAMPPTVTPDEAAANARALFEADEITVEAYEAELDRLIAKGARLR